MEPDAIVIHGAREHNLKNINAVVPKKKLVVLTGVSGSGKSSLAFDTLYAEGQRRYVESLSAYARQFLGQMDKPKYDTIRGLSPTISIEQKAASNNPRSTVGTITEVHDYLRVLYANTGVQHCHKCGRTVGKQGSQQVVDEVMRLGEGAGVYLMAPVVVRRKGEHKEIIADIARQGFTRLRVDGEVHRTDDEIFLDKKRAHDIDIVVDRLRVSEKVRDRLADSVETALKAGNGVIIVAPALADGTPSRKRQKVLSQHLACPHCGISFPELRPHSFSFNSPLGFCEACNGLGTRNEMDPDLIVPDPNRSISEGAVEPWANAMEKGEGWTHDFVIALARTFEIDLHAPWKRLAKAKRDIILYGAGSRRVALDWPGRARPVYKRFDGVVNRMMHRFLETGSERQRKYYLQYFSNKPCAECNGERLRPESRAVKIHGHTLPELSGMTITGALTHLANMPLTENETIIATELLKEIKGRLGFLVDVGLGYLTLDRAGASLSGGEAQRIRLASQLGSELTGVIYVLDEPSIGLHPRDTSKLLSTLKRLRDMGNSVVVVEHDPGTIEAADWVLDFGPGAGMKGGEIVATGTPRQIESADRSLTGKYLSGELQIDVPARRQPRNAKNLTVLKARENNLKAVDVTVPLGLLVAVTGVSGAGKSTLVTNILIPALMRGLHGSRGPVGRHDSIQGLEHLDKVIHIDQKPIGRTPRSNPATYTKVFDGIRRVLSMTPEARAFGYKPGRFSFNVKGGRCDACNGDGVRVVEMHFLPDVYVPCEICGGRRFNEATLRVRYRGKNVAEILDMSVTEAMDHFSVHQDIVRALRTLDDVGMGYVQLGQPSPTLSGGEAQRVKLSRELARRATGRTLYVLDEPTTGLHFDDIKKLLAVLERLVQTGNTVVIIEHNLEVIKCADHVVDLGPDGGDAGGWVVAEGTPEEITRIEESHTGRALRPLLQHRKARPVKGDKANSSAEQQKKKRKRPQRRRALP